MANKQFRKLLKNMQSIAKAVNAFESESLQQRAFETLLAALEQTPAEESVSEHAETSTETVASASAALSTEQILEQARQGIAKETAKPSKEKSKSPSKTPQTAATTAETVSADLVEEKGEAPQSEVETIKRESRFLRGDIAAELRDGQDHFGKGSVQLLKHHGTYQQDNRDLRSKGGSKSQRSFMFMVRTKIPGGRLTGDQLLSELDLSEEVGNATLRITSRQGLQLHGVVKDDLQRTIRRINEVQLSTLGACGDVNRNVMCCPAPYQAPIFQEIQGLADELASHLAPHTSAYHELWLQEDGSEERQLVGGGPNGQGVEPIYGAQYMPRKFKIGIGTAFDNCVDLYTHDLGFMAVTNNDRIVGYNVLVGGGQGVTPSAKKTFPALGKRMAFITPEQAIDVATAVVKVQRDFGNRSDRKRARLKYLIHDWGLERFKESVEKYYGQSLDPAHEADIHGFNDHLGWDEQGDGKWFYGLNVENGRIHDTEQMQLKTAIREICRTYRPGIHLTTHQSMLITNLAEGDKGEIERILREHHVPLVEEVSNVRRWSMACVAWPTCGLSITEAERALPGLMDTMEAELARLGLSNEKFTVRMTGCPNGCARPYNSDIGLVGKTKGKYTVFVGGRLLGNRMNFVYKDLVPEDEVVPTLLPLFAYFKQDRQEGETFGDFCHRKGQSDLLTWAESYQELQTAN